MRLPALLKNVPPAAEPRRPFLTGLGRGFTRRCPACGEGRLFDGYLKVRPVCDACGADNDRYPADDAPPYFTILPVGRLVVGPMLWLHAITTWPLWQSMSVFPPAVVALYAGPAAFRQGRRHRGGVVARDRGRAGSDAADLRPLTAAGHDQDAAGGRGAVAASASTSRRVGASRSQPASRRPRAGVPRAGRPARAAAGAPAGCRPAPHRGPERLDRDDLEARPRGTRRARPKARGRSVLRARLEAGHQPLPRLPWQECREAGRPSGGPLSRRGDGDGEPPPGARTRQASATAGSGKPGGPRAGCWP